MQRTTSEILCDAAGRTQVSKMPVRSRPRIMRNRDRVGEFAPKGPLRRTLHSGRTFEEGLLAVTNEVPPLPCGKVGGSFWRVLP